MLVLIWCAFLAVAVVTVKAWRGDGRTDLRRCPRCWYDMSATDTRICPECGHSARLESELHQGRRSRAVYRMGMVGMGLLALAGVHTGIPGPWTAKVPRPLLRLILDLAAPPPAPPNAGSGLPVPSRALFASTMAWDRLVWQHQASIAFDAWADAVLATEGPITDDELARLVPLANEATALFGQTALLTLREAWNLNATRERLASARAAAAGDADRLLRIEWALSELQYGGGGYSRRPDFARLPDAIILRALNHADSNVRSFGLNGVGRRAHEVVMDRASPPLVGRGLVEAIATSDPQPSLRKQAADLIEYMDTYLPKD